MNPVPPVKTILFILDPLGTIEITEQNARLIINHNHGDRRIARGEPRGNATLKTQKRTMAGKYYRLTTGERCEALRLFCHAVIYVPELKFPIEVPGPGSRDAQKSTRCE